MSFILSDQRHSIEEMSAGFRRYYEYVAANRHLFPPSALALAESEWYYNAVEHQCPHDAWLEHVMIEEPSAGSRHEVRETAITIRLLGAYHDGYIELRYPRVTRYEMRHDKSIRGHGDWRYDEFRVGSDGGIVHEIEWTGGGRWVIEAGDVTFAWHSAGIPKRVP